MEVLQFNLNLDAEMKSNRFQNSASGFAGQRVENMHMHEKQPSVFSASLSICQTIRFRQWGRDLNIVHFIRFSNAN
jgi:hypothetical protein